MIKQRRKRSEIRDENITSIINELNRLIGGSHLTCRYSHKNRDDEYLIVFDNEESYQRYHQLCEKERVKTKPGSAFEADFMDCDHPSILDDSLLTYVSLDEYSFFTTLGAKILKLENLRPLYY